MKYLIVSCSLNPKSRSRQLATEALLRVKSRSDGSEVELIDLVDYPLPLCDGQAANSKPNVKSLKAKMSATDGILLAVPIYNYDVNSACKNLIELTGRDVWTQKVVGFICAAGGKSSYMSVMAVAGSLMLDFRAHIVPRFLYATGADFGEDGRITTQIDQRLDVLIREFTEVTAALEPLRHLR